MLRNLRSRALWVCSIFLRDCIKLTFNSTDLEL